MPAAATEIPVNPSTAANMAMMKNAMAQRNNCSPPDACLWICSASLRAMRRECYYLTWRKPRESIPRIPYALLKERLDTCLAMSVGAFPHQTVLSWA